MRPYLTHTYDNGIFWSVYIRQRAFRFSGLTGCTRTSACDLYQWAYHSQLYANLIGIEMSIPFGRERCLAAEDATRRNKFNRTYLPPRAFPISYAARALRK